MTGRIVRIQIDTDVLEPGVRSPIAALLSTRANAKHHIHVWPHLVRKRAVDAQIITRIQHPMTSALRYHWRLYALRNLADLAGRAQRAATHDNERSLRAQ